MPGTHESPSRAGTAALSIPRLLIGTERLGSVLPGGIGPANDYETFRVLDELLAAGAEALDTAASYQLGGSERLLGDWLVSRRVRDNLFIVSKGGHPYPIVRPNRLGIDDIAGDLHASLKRLRTDRLDLYLLHRDHPAANLEKLALALDEHRRLGKIGAWGVSNWQHDRILAFERTAASLGVPGPCVSSPHFSLAEWSTPPWKGCVSIAGASQKVAREFYARSGMPVLAYSALGRGFFSSAPKSSLQPAYLHASNYAKKLRAVELAERLNVQPTQIALAYLFHQPFPVHPIIAVGSAMHFRTNQEAADIHLSPEDCRWLEHG